MILIYGASDDLVEVEGCEGADEFNVYGRDGDSEVCWRGDLIAPGADQLRVHAIYDGCWHVAVGQVDEDVPLPPWPLSFEQGDGGHFPKYTVVLRIDAPDGTRLAPLEQSP